MSDYRLLKNRVRPEIKRFAKQLRANQTHSEKWLWKFLKGHKFHNLRFRRQHVVRGYILDFYCPAKRLGIEVDGLGHNKEKDAIRDRNILRNCRISILRFSNDDVEKRISQVLKRIALNCGVTSFAQNPQAQQQQELPKPLEIRDCDDESCGNSGNVEIRPVCKKQVYSCLEVAETTVRAFSQIGIRARAYRCEACHLVHVEEVLIRRNA